jgi:hypothetical protein
MKRAFGADIGIIQTHPASSSSHPNFSAIFYARIELDIPAYASYLAI